MSTMTGLDAMILGFLGAVYSLTQLFYTTGILINYTRFTGTDIPPYTDRLQNESSFHILMIGTVLSATGLGTAVILRLLHLPYAADTFIIAPIPFLGTLLYFVRAMHAVTYPR